MDNASLQSAATAVRILSMDAVQKSNSGHPGLPMGCAELGALLYGELLNHYPDDPQWINRDRFVLSAGHGCMLLYSLLYLSGYGLTLEDIKNFRQLGSKTPGHPEYGQTRGVETTTGPLGQGIGNAVGFALAETQLAARFNTEKHKIIDHYTYVLVGDGDLMEGISSEACSLAGHLGLGKLIVFYDSNKITIEGSTELAFTEDVLARFAAYNWQTLEADGYNADEIRSCVRQAKEQADRPTLIKLATVIAKGAPNLAGHHSTHGSPLGEEEIRASKEAMQVPMDEFYVPAEAVTFFEHRKEELARQFHQWQESFEAWSAENDELHRTWERFFGQPDITGVALPDFPVGEKMATRKASAAVLNALAAGIPNLIGGSADLAPSNNTELKGLGSYQRDNPSGRNLHFGVREHGMGAIVNGIALHGGLRPFCATFMVFSDYMRPSIRLAALMKLPVIYIFTHDSIFVGEDGPTHQPVEQLAALRAIPGLLVLRPGDPEETRAAWVQAIENSAGPTVLALTRQNLEVYPKPDTWEKDLAYGAYIAKDSEGVPDVILVATGSEVNLALQTARQLDSDRVRVVSMLSRERFLRAPEAYRQALIPESARRIVVEAGVPMGWEGIASGGDIFALDRFGESGPAEQVAEHLGLTADKIAAAIRSKK